MKTIAQLIGYAYILACVLGMLDLVDMYVCVGKPGACQVASAPKKATTV